MIYQIKCTSLNEELKPTPMKKNLLSLIAVLFLCSISVAQNPVPNPGFENWSTGEPVSWTTNNFGPTTLTQTFIAHTGASSIRGEVIQTGPSTCYAPLLMSSTLGQGFSVSQLYGNMKFWYRFNSVSSDIFFGSVAILDASSSVIGAGSGVIFTGTTAWTEYTVPITYTGSGPSKCLITFTVGDSGGGGNVNCGSYFLADDVQLTDVIGIEEASANAASFTVAGNPASENIFIERSFTANKTTVELLDCLGKKITEAIIAPGERNLSIHVKPLAAGFYFVRLMNGQGQMTKKIAVQH